MKKRIIVVGSLIAIALIVLVSFNSVVSIQTSKSESRAVASPLFSIRTRRAIKEESKDALTCNYVGRGRGITIPLPTRVDRTALLQGVIDSIGKMDDEAFIRFVCLVIRNGIDKNIIKEEQTQEVLPLLYPFKDNPQALRNLGGSLNTWYEMCTLVYLTCEMPWLSLLLLLVVLLWMYIPIILA